MNQREKADIAIVEMAESMRKIRAILEASERRRMQAEMEVSADRELPSSELQKRPADKVREHEVQLHRFNISYPGDKVVASKVEGLQHQVDSLLESMKHAGDALSASRKEVVELRGRVNGLTRRVDELEKPSITAFGRPMRMPHVEHRLEERKPILDPDSERRIKELDGRVNALDETLTDIRSGWLSSSSPPMSSKVAENLERRIEQLEAQMGGVCDA